MNISVEAEIESAARYLTSLEKKQLPYATSRALNDIAFDSRADLIKSTDTYINNPTPFTKRAFFVDKSNKANLTAKVYIASTQWRYLKWIILGGIETGQLMPPVEQRVNKYGNIPGLRRKKPLWNDGEAAGKKEFVGEVKGFKGVWSRTKKGIRYMVAFIKKATYTSIFPYYKIVHNTVDKRYSKHLSKWIERAIRTAK